MGAAKEILELRLHHGVDDQPGAEPGDLLEGDSEVDPLHEQGIDLATGFRSGRYSYRHGRGSIFGSLAAIEAKPTSVVIYTPGWDATTRRRKFVSGAGTGVSSLHAHGR
jgi:hypothetical protein